MQVQVQSSVFDGCTSETTSSTTCHVEVTIPVLNEEMTLEYSIRTLVRFMAQHCDKAQYEWSIVVADNGSSDGTGYIAQALCLEFPSLRYLRLDQRGVGRALKASWAASEADIVGYMDADLATSLQHLIEALELLRNRKCDLVYGTRLHTRSVVKGRSLKREIASRAFNRLLRSYLGMKASDGMCGFKFMQASLARQVMARGATDDGWFFCTELLFFAERLDAGIWELPVVWTDSRESKVRVFSLALRYLKSMHKLKRVYDRPGRTTA